jgi:hypothetical protein
MTDYTLRVRCPHPSTLTQLYGLVGEAGAEVVGRAERVEEPAQRTPMRCADCGANDHMGCDWSSVT